MKMLNILLQKAYVFEFSKKIFTSKSLFTICRCSRKKVKFVENSKMSLISTTATDEDALG